MNFNKLKAKVIELNKTISQMCNDCHIEKSGFYRRFYNGSDKVTIKEIKIISKYLNLTHDEIMDIFFTENVAQHANL